MKSAKQIPKKKGRPSKYREEFDIQAYKLCLLGATDEELAGFFEVNVDSIYEWKKVHPSFSETIKKGKEVADATVAESLYKRATGYNHAAVKIFNDNGSEMIVPYVEHYPPDPTSMIFWLKNRQPAKWRDKQEVQQTSVNYNAELTAKDIKQIGKHLDKEY